MEKDPLAGMENLLQKILAKDFVIDEPPEDFPEPTRPSEPSDSPAGDEEAEGLGAVDLVGQVASMMIEQERLRSLAQELSDRSGESTAGEFGGFFKRSLPVLDSLDRILHMYELQDKPSEELQNWIKSVAALRTRVANLFERFGLRSMDPVGKPVNLDRHEVVDVVHTDSIPEETVVETRQKGYTFNGKVLRDAQVVVAKNDRS